MPPLPQFPAPATLGNAPPTSQEVIGPSYSQALGHPGWYWREVLACEFPFALEAWAAVSSGTPVTTSQAMTGGGLRIATDNNIAAVYRFKGTGAAFLGDPTTTGNYPVHPAPNAFPWALRMVCSLAPGANSPNEVMWIAAWSSSDSSIGGSGTGVGACGLVYQQGHLVIRGLATDTGPSPFDSVTSWVDDGTGTTHVFELVFDGAVASAYVDGVLVGTQPMLAGFPAKPAFPFFGLKNIALFDNQFSIRVNSFGFAVNRDQGHL